MNFERAALSGLFAIVVCGVLAGVTCLINVATSTGKIDYCRVEYYHSYNTLPSYRVVGHREWRKDIDVAVVATPEEAALKVKLLCPN